MRKVTLLSVLIVGLFFTPSVCGAAVQSVTWNYFDPETGEISPENSVVIVPDGSAEVPFSIYGFLEIEADLSPFAGVAGELYLVTNPEAGERELVGTSDNVIWTQEGIYELDVYEFLEVPMRTPLQRFFAWLLPVAHAAPEEWTYVETIRFSITQTAPPCCSSVLFLPGFQGSALKEGSDVLWPPSAFSSDVARLALNENGESVNNIRVAGVLSDFYGTPIYEGFAEFMDGLVGEGTINAWKPFAYDWRLPLGETLSEGVMYEGEEDPVYLLEEVENLASESKTGKVTIVAHSMGGLLGKMLIKKLEEDGNENLIDSFVMVGTPQLGTPQSAAALLHGDQQGIAGGIFVKSSVARQVAQNMQSAYSLLPSSKYFEEVADPIISFNSNASFTDEWRAKWGNTLDNSSEFTEFVTGTGVVRTPPNPNNLAQPEVLRSDLIQDAQNLHTDFDTYEFPDGIRVVQLAGWGNPTVKGIEYKNKHIIFQGYEPYFTREGDSTVLYSSAVSSNVETYFFNIFDYNDTFDSEIQHRDITSAKPVSDVITSLLNRQLSLTTDFITETKPPLDELEDQLVVSTKSPVVLGVSDSNGNYTGIVQGQDLTSEILEFVEEIPGSIFIASGEDQFIFLPKEGSYIFEFEGTDAGPASIETSTFSEDIMQVVAVYSDIPVTSETRGSFTINTAAPTDTFIQVDINGTGEITSIPPDGYVPPLPPSDPSIFELISALKEKIKKSDISFRQKEKLLKRIEKVERNLLSFKEKKPKLFKHFESIFLKMMSKWSMHNLDSRRLPQIVGDMEGRL